VVVVEVVVVVVVVVEVVVVVISVVVVDESQDAINSTLGLKQTSKSSFEYKHPSSQRGSLPSFKL